METKEAKKRQSSDITSLEHEATAMDYSAEMLRRNVDIQRNCGQHIYPEVERWLSNYNLIKDQVKGIMNESSKIKGTGCFNLGPRLSLDMRAKELTKRVKELRGQCKFREMISYWPPVATLPFPLQRLNDLESRKTIEQEITKTLRDGDVNMIGIYGMEEGLGKTTTALKIMNKLLEDKVIQEIVRVDVGSEVNMSKILDEMGGDLRVFRGKDASPAVKVQKLHAHLTDTSRRTLLLLDDVREGLELERLGIPRCSKGCTILVTSRSRDALRAMCVERVFEMEALPEEDAWFLFKEKAGSCVEKPDIKPMAKEIMRACEGLPVALTTIGLERRGYPTDYAWRDFLTYYKRLPSERRRRTWKSLLRKNY